MTTKPKPFDMIVVGGTGDLARRKLLPALYFLHQLGSASCYLSKRILKSTALLM